MMVVVVLVSCFRQLLQLRKVFHVVTAIINVVIVIIVGSRLSTTCS